MDRKILRLALVIAVSLFVGTVFTGCNDGEDASEPYLLKKEDIRVSQPEGGFAVVVDQLLKVRVESESDEGISYLWLLDGSEIAVSIRPRACFSPSYNKVKSQTKHVWLLTLL